MAASVNALPVFHDACAAEYNCLLGCDVFTLKMILRNRNSARCHNPEKLDLNLHRRENFKSRIATVCFIRIFYHIFR